MLTDIASAGVLEEFDALFLDLDGVVYRSGEAVPQAVDSLNHAQARGIQLRFLTNNASRTRTVVASHLRSLGLKLDEGMVITSAMAIANEMRSYLPQGSLVYLVGAEGLHEALESEGFGVTRNSSDPSVTAVVQGHSEQTNWADIAHAGYLISEGLPWFASNTDSSIPTRRGLAPGNGAFVRLLAELTHAAPIVAGKPHQPLFSTALASIASGRVLMVGDRLDTDIEGANRLGITSAWVNTGVHDLIDVINAPRELRPAMVFDDLSALSRAQPAVEHDESSTRCGLATAALLDQSVVLTSEGSSREEEFRALVALGWKIRDVGTIEGELNATLNL